MKAYKLKSELIPRYHNYDCECVGTTLTKVGDEDLVTYEETINDSLPYYYVGHDELSIDAFIVRFYLSYSEEHLKENIELLNKITPLFHFLTADLVNVWEDTSITVEGIVNMPPHKFIKEFVRILSGR